MTLRISPDLSLPLDTITSTLVVYGGKGMGKTVLGAVLAEELSRAGLRWAWLDPLGVGYGLRYAADGRGAGIECLILGGPRGDIPIEPTGGAAVADVVVEESVNVLVDFSRKPSGEMWGVGEKIRFVTDYARRLFQRQGDFFDGHRRDPLFQILDEAARYIPQTIPAGNPDLAKCVSVWQQVVEEGRNIGLGVGLITQRSARMNKDVSELADAMFAFRTIGPNSLAAVLDWLGEHVPRERVKELSGKVRSLARGEALVVSPGWLEFEGVVRVRQRSTFDSSATPKAGERAKTTKGEGAKPDLEKIRARMAATIEKAKAEDPKALRVRIAELERQLESESGALVLDPDAIEELEGEIEAYLEEQASKLRAHLSESLLLQVSSIRAAVRGWAERVGQISAAPSSETMRAPRADRSKKSEKASAVDRTDGPAGTVNGLSKCARAILVAAAQRRPKPSTKNQLAIMSGYSVTSGGFGAALAELRAAGHLEGAENLITKTGLHEVGNVPALPSGAALAEQWIGRLPKCEGVVLRSLIDLGKGRGLSKGALAEKTGYSETSGGFGNALANLRTLELITRGQTIAAAEEFFG